MTTAATHHDPAPVAAPGRPATTHRPAGAGVVRRFLGRLPLLVLQLSIAVLALGYAAAAWLLLKAAFTLVARTVSAT